MDHYRKEKRLLIFHLHLINSDVYNCVLLNFQFAIGRLIIAGCDDLKGQACLLISVNKGFLLSFVIKCQHQSWS
jgi:hypothetical protein